MTKPKGGRGKRSDSPSEMLRIPSAIKDRVIALKELYYNDELDIYEQKLAENERLANQHQNLISSSSDSTSNSISSLEAIALAKVLLAENAKQKKSVRYVVAKLISGLYGEEIKPEDL